MVEPPTPLFSRRKNSELVEAFYEVCTFSGDVLLSNFKDVWPLLPPALRKLGYHTTSKAFYEFKRNRGFSSCRFADNSCVIVTWDDHQLFQLIRSQSTSLAYETDLESDNCGVYTVVRDYNVEDADHYGSLVINGFIAFARKLACSHAPGARLRDAPIGLFYNRYDPLNGQSVKMHVDDAPMMSQVFCLQQDETERKCLYLVTAKGKRNYIALGEGDILNIAANVPHGVRAPKHVRITLIVFW
jgi:hypothetical protein